MCKKILGVISAIVITLGNAAAAVILTPDSADWMFEPNQVNTGVPWTGGNLRVDMDVTTGDFNGDGNIDIAIAVPHYDNGQQNEGAVFVYYGPLNENGTPSNCDWMFESNQPNAWLWDVHAGDFNGDGYDDLAIGVARYDRGQTDEGVIFVYYGSSTGLGENGTPANADWIAETNQANSIFLIRDADDVNNDGYDDIIARAQLYDNGQTNEGVIFVWYGSPTGLGANGTPANADWRAESNQAYACLNAAHVIDANSDGYNDIVGLWYRYDNGQTDEGVAFVWYGSPTGLGANGTPANADWRAETDQAYAYMNSALSGSYDFNGDGYKDIAIDAIYYDNGEVDEGAVFVWYNSSQDLPYPGNPANADWVGETNQANAWLVLPYKTDIIDLNQDGYDDLLAFAPNYDNGETDEGIVCIWLGSAQGLVKGENGNPSNCDVLFETNQDSAYVCRPLISDLNNDNVPDLIVCSPKYDHGETDEGAVFVFYGPILPFEEHADIYITGRGSQPKESPFWIYVEVGSPDSLIRDLFGISFDIYFTNTYFTDALDVEYMDENGNYYLLGSDIVTVDKIDDANGKISVGISRKQGAGGVTGYGKICRIEFEFNPEASFGDSTILRLTNMKAINSQGDTIHLEVGLPFKITVSESIAVWPGDCDNNGVVEAADVLPLGFFWKNTGPVTAGIDKPLKWYRQIRAPWEPREATFSDANNDGVIDGADLLAIGVNWKKCHIVRTGQVWKGEKFSIPMDKISEHIENYKEMLKLMEKMEETEPIREMKILLKDIISEAEDFSKQVINISPNPVYGGNVKIYVETPQSAKMKIYDATGRVMYSINLNKAGKHIIYWDCKLNDKRINPGVYFCRLEGGKFNRVKKIVIIK